MPRYLPDNNLSFPVLLALQSGGSGSGFFYNHQNEFIYLVTAAHVLFDPDKDYEKRSDVFQAISYDLNLADQEPIINEIDLKVAGFRLDKENDVAVIKFGKCEKKGDVEGMTLCPGIVERKRKKDSNIVVVHFDHVKTFEKSLISNESVIFGYPVSLGNPKNPQFEMHRPLLRKGMVAGKNYAKKRIIIDGAVYFGNSGGLVLECEWLKNGQRKLDVIGIVSEYIPFYDVLVSKQHKYEHVSVDNSGYAVVIPMDFVIALTGKN